MIDVIPTNQKGDSMKNTIAVIGGAIAVTAVVIVLILWAAGIGIFSAHVQAVVAKKTLDSKVTVQVFNANNKIQSQGYFESLNADFHGYLVKIKFQKAVVADDSSSYNKTNLLGLRQQCVDTAQTYNAAALSISSQAFLSADLPPTLDPTPCGN